MNGLILLSDSYLFKYCLMSRKSFENYLNSSISVYFSPITNHYYLLDDDNTLFDWYKESFEVSDFFYNESYQNCVYEFFDIKGECVDE